MVRFAFVVLLSGLVLAGVPLSFRGPGRSNGNHQNPGCSLTCKDQTCEAVPEAECSVSKCTFDHSSCMLSWWLGNHRVDCGDGTVRYINCSAGVERIFRRKRNPCLGAKCSIPGAYCVPDHCGGHFARWFVGHALVDCEPTLKATESPAGPILLKEVPPPESLSSDCDDEKCEL